MTMAYFMRSCYAAHGFAQTRKRRTRTANILWEEHGSRDFDMGSERPSEPAIDTTAPTLPGRELAETVAPGAGPTLDSTDLPPELRDHSRYRIVRLLGRGGMGAVYEALHTVMDRPVALKVMRPEFTENPAALERFRREVKAAAQLVHPNIVTAYDAEQVGNTHFLVMEYVNGSTLAEVVASDGPLPIDVAVDYMAQAACGLQYAFEKGMIHRDIKPQNLMRTGTLINAETACFPHGQIKILDFGLARFTSDGGSGQTASGMILGTVDFIAPEQADSAKSADIRSDIYSLGCTFYYLLAGRVPFPDGSVIQRVMAHVDKEPPSLNTLRPGLPTGLVAVVAKMLAKKPADRYHTPAEVGHALEALGTGATSSAATVVVAEPMLEVIPVGPAPRPRLKKPPPPPEPKPRKSRTLLGCFVLALVAILAVTGLVGYGIYLVVDRTSRGVTKIFSDAKKDAQNWEEVAKNFTPPDNDVEHDKLFPSHVGEFQRQGVNAAAKVPELEIDLTGRHANYSFAVNEIDVYAYHPVTQLEKEAIFQRAISIVEKAKAAKNGVTMHSGTPKNDHVAIRVETTRGKSRGLRAAMWWNDGWLFVLTSPTSVDPEPLLLEYLQWLNMH
jgi:serine/threonine protein kinase